MPRGPRISRPTALALLPVAAALGLAAAVLRYPILTPDVWWHLATGRWIATAGIPRTDPFAWPLAGKPWMLHEWLADRILYGFEAAAGLRGVVFLRALLVVLAAAMCFRLARKHAGPLLALAFVALAAWASQRNWLDRPQLWSYVLAPLVLWLLETDRLQPRRWIAVALPVVFALWVNLHGAFMLGAGFVVLWCIGRLVDERASPGARRAALVGVLCLVATVANPHGIAGAIYPLRYVGSGLGATIQEEMPGDLDSAPAVISFLLVVATLVLVCGGAIARPRRVPLAHALVAGALAWLAMPRLLGWAPPLAAERHAPLFLFAGVPFLAWRVAMLGGGCVQAFEGRAATQAAAAPAWIVATVLAMFTLWQAARAWPRDNSERALLLPGRFPVAAADWLAAQSLPPRLLNPYRWGGYLLWRLAPRYQVWIDSRGDLHGARRLAEDELLYRMPAGSEPAVAALLARDDPDVIVTYLLTIDFGPLQVHPFARSLLAARDDWRLVYVDPADPADPQRPWATTAVFLRVHPRNAASLAALPEAPLPRGLPR